MDLGLRTWPPSRNNQIRCCLEHEGIFIIVIGKRTVVGDRKVRGNEFSMSAPKLRLASGLFLILLGALFFLAQVFGEELNLGDILELLWPVGLILLGIFLLWRHGGRRGSGGRGQTRTTVFGDLKLDGDDIEPDGLDTALGFGDLTLDLTTARLADKEYRIDVNLVFGDIKIILPAGLPVRAEGSSLAGDLHLLSKSGHGLGNHVTYESEGYSAARKKISLKASCVFGDIIVTAA